MKVERAHEAGSGGVLGRGLASAWERLGPLSTGAVASGVLLVAGGRVLRRALGSHRSRRLGWSVLAALVPLGLWLLTEHGGTNEGEQRGADRARESEPGTAHGKTGGMESMNVGR